MSAHWVGIVLPGHDNYMVTFGLSTQKEADRVPKVSKRIGMDNYKCPSKY